MPEMNPIPISRSSFGATEVRRHGQRCADAGVFDPNALKRGFHAAMVLVAPRRMMSFVGWRARSLA